MILILVCFMNFDYELIFLGTLSIGRLRLRLKLGSSREDLLLIPGTWPLFVRASLW